MHEWSRQVTWIDGCGLVGWGNGAGTGGSHGPGRRCGGVLLSNGLTAVAQRKQHNDLQCLLSK